MHIEVQGMRIFFHFGFVFREFQLCYKLPVRKACGFACPGSHDAYPVAFFAVIMVVMPLAALVHLYLQDETSSNCYDCISHSLKTNSKS